jgi:anti-anti-sigma factor
MEIRERKHGAVAIIKPLGPLTQPDVEGFLTRMLEVRDRSLGRMVLDASDILYVDSQGLEVLVEVGDELARAGQTLKICGANEVLQQVFELTELAPSFELFVDVNTAVRSFL